jgi:hypothetical protein
MKSNLKVLLSAAGVVALLASPAMADSSARHRSAIHRHAAPATVYVPGNAYGYRGRSLETNSDQWCVTHPSWDACHDPRENPQL